MDNYTLGLLLDYLYNKFAVTFILSLVGASMREVFVTNRNRKNHIKISKLLTSAIMVTVLLCALGELYKFDFSVYVLVCVMCGLWGEFIVTRILLNRRIMISFIINLFKKLGGSFSSAAAEALAEEDKNKKSNRKKTNKLIITDTTDSNADVNKKDT